MVDSKCLKNMKSSIRLIPTGPQRFILVARESVILQSDLTGKTEEKTIGKVIWDTRLEIGVGKNKCEKVSYFYKLYILWQIINIIDCCSLYEFCYWS